MQQDKAITDGVRALGNILIERTEEWAVSWRCMILESIGRLGDSRQLRVRLQDRRPGPCGVMPDRGPHRAWPVVLGLSRMSSAAEIPKVGDLVPHVMRAIESHRGLATNEEIVAFIVRDLELSPEQASEPHDKVLGKENAPSWSTALPGRGRG